MQPTAIVWTDGAWDSTPSGRAVGAVLASPDTRAALGAPIPTGLQQALCAGGKEQRNTQAELLAVLVALLAWGAQLRGHAVWFLQDNEAALWNIMLGTAVDSHSFGR